MQARSHSTFLVSGAPYSDVQSSSISARYEVIGRPRERHLRALFQLLVHLWPRRQRDRDRGVGDVPFDLGGHADLDEVAPFYDPAAGNTMHGLVVYADEVDAREPVHRPRRRPRPVMLVETTAPYGVQLRCRHSRLQGYSHLPKGARSLSDSSVIAAPLARAMSVSASSYCRTVV